ncbi:zinc finger protein 740 isoform X5 [Balaenoptera musculus]|uniref:Zinc finger protein 740 isoform X5 n=1 Tax=Balaenoptera musculus TaxID=9771 RepID=A0A8B8YE13_BALMU|nr:zinc finger protein 740 isoform X5 [Balaenoptera musculus]
MAQSHRKDSDKSRSRKDDDSLAEASHSKKTVKKVVVVEQNGSFQVKIPKNFVCEHCFGAFRSSYHLKRHILIHTGEKPFECDICDMRFIQKYHLERHKRVHSGEKPYQCERCHQALLRALRLNLQNTRMKAPGGRDLVPLVLHSVLSPKNCTCLEIDAQ